MDAVSDDPATVATGKRLVVNPKYSPLLSPSGVLECATRYLIVTGGRGSGKSFALSLALTLAAREIGMRCLFTRWTMASAKDSILPEFREKIELLASADEFRVTANDITHVASGSTVMFRGIKTAAGNQTAKLKSLHGLNAWVLDEAEEMPDERTFETIDLSIRDRRGRDLVSLSLNPAHKRHWIYRRFFERRGIPAGFCGTRGDTTYIHTTFEDNLENLPASYQQRILDGLRGNPARFAHIWGGAWAEEVQGALWNYAMIADHRREREEMPDLERVLVAVDPNASSGPGADEAGIVVGGRGTDGHIYVLEDASGQMGPAEWARVACQKYEIHKADRIVAEKNQGGDMVTLTIQGYRPDVPVSLVNASRGKITRAEPVASLYSQGKVHHVGRFPELESEMMSYTGRPGSCSPNRLDALAWLVSALCEAGEDTASDGEMLGGCVV